MVMTAWKKLLAMGVATTMLGACMHHNTYSGVEGGEVSVDSISALRTALLRIDNNSGQEVRVYTLLPGQKANYVAKAMSGQVRTWVLDPMLFPAQAISFEVRPANGGMARTFGPYRVNRNETVEMVVPSDMSAAHATIHRSTP
jgi:hypothetical protein